MQGAEVSNAPALGAWEGPAILLVDLDAFFASVEQLDHPEWRGKPVIVGGDASKRGVVATASYEARRFGVHSAMASSQAQALCPQAIWTPGHYARYTELSQLIMGYLRDESPFVQQVSIDEAFVDVTPTRLNPEHPASVAARIQGRVAALGLGCSIGVGSTKTIAKIASEAEKPRGLTVVYPGREQAFLAPLPIRAMSGIGAAAERQLHAAGVRTLGDLARADESLLRRVFGKNAGLMRKRALGGEQSPVRTDDEVKSVSKEVSFAVDLTSRSDVMASLRSLCLQVCRRLRKAGLAGSCLTLKVRYANRQLRTAQMHIARPSSNDADFLPFLEPLLAQLWDDGTPVRLLGVGVSAFGGEEAAAVQESLFGADEQELATACERAKRESLNAATDAVLARFGADSLQFGCELHNRENISGR